MNSTAVLTDYTTALRDEPERWLGLMVLYSVAETTIPHADLVELLTANGLEKHIPARPNDADVFRRTCTEAQRKRQATADPGVYVNVMVRDVANDDDEVIKRLVCEVVDKDARRLAYSEVYDLVFAKATSTVDVRRIGVAPHPAADEVAMKIAVEYNLAVGTVDGACVRTVIARVLDGVHATSLRPGGGAYFVGRDDAGVVAGLEAFAAAVPGTMVHSVPLPDDVKQRANLVEAVEAEAKVDINRACAEIAVLLASKERPSARKMATIAGQYRGLKDKAQRYAGLLEVDLGGTRAALDVLDMQMAQLVGL